MKKLIKIIGFLAFAAVIGLNLQVLTNNGASSDVTLNNIVTKVWANGESGTGTGDCGTGYMYFCGYFDGIDHPDFYAYEGPWLT
jgi:hypothetical protein